MKSGGINISPVARLAVAAQFFPAQVAAAALAETRVHEHRNGLHPVGSMRRDCPLCQGSGR